MSGDAVSVFEMLVSGAHSILCGADQVLDLDTSKKIKNKAKLYIRLRFGLAA